MTTIPFCGRHRELAELATYLQGNQCVAVVGAEGIGKTALLRYLGRAAGGDPARLTVYVEGNTLAKGGHVEAFGRLATAAAQALAEKGLSQEPVLLAAAAQPSRLAFEAAMRKLNGRGLAVVFAWDDFEVAGENPDLDAAFFSVLRSIATRYRLAFVVTTARPLVELTYAGRASEVLSSPFFNIFATLVLGPLPDDEARELLRACGPLEGATEEFVLALAGGDPPVLLAACRHALAVPGDTAEIERRTLLEVGARFQSAWANLAIAQRQRLQAAARGEFATAAAGACDRMALQALVQQGWLVATREGYRCPSRARVQFVGQQA